MGELHWIAQAKLRGGLEPEAARRSPGRRVFARARHVQFPRTIQSWFVIGGQELVV
jgi:hypothetical protein